MYMYALENTFHKKILTLTVFQQEAFSLKLWYDANMELKNILDRKFLLAVFAT